MKNSFDKIREAIHSVSPITAKDWKLCKPGLKYKEIKKAKYFVEEGKSYKEIAFVLSGSFRAYYIGRRRNKL